MIQVAGPAEPEVLVSEERFVTVADGIDLCYQTFGDPSDEPLVLVMGLAGPMIWWHADLCRMLAGAGFFVIRFDNRDIGRSSRAPGWVRKPHLFRAYAGLQVDPPYSLDDMAQDTFGLLDHLGLESAHLYGVSMGAMIAQTMAITRQDRVRSLTSMMSTTGRRSVGWQDPRVLPALLSRGRDRERYVEASVTVRRLIESPAYPDPEEEIRRRAEETFDRGVSAGGILRQMLAVASQTDRTEALGNLTIPACVLHGRQDRLVHVSGGRATARAIPGAELILLDGHGHDIPRPLWPTFVDAVRRTADRAATRS